MYQEPATPILTPTIKVPTRSDDVAQKKVETPSGDSRIIVQIRELWAIRQSWVAEEVALILRGTAICRRHISKRDAIPHGTKMSKEQLTEASRLFYQYLEGKGEDRGLNFKLEAILRALRAMRPSLAFSAKQLKDMEINGMERGATRDSIEKELKKLVRNLPIWEWVEQQHGFGDINLAGLIGEAGDIGNYRNPSCLWKRMGLAVIDGQRQRKVTDVELAQRMGYAPHRHALAYVIGGCLMRTGEKNPFRSAYDERREKFQAKTKAHSHNDAQRYMVKRALRELWKAWRRTQAVSDTLSKIAPPHSIPA